MGIRLVDRYEVLCQRQEFLTEKVGIVFNIKFSPRHGKHWNSYGPLSDFSVLYVEFGVHMTRAHDNVYNFMSYAEKSYFA